MNYSDVSTYNKSFLDLIKCVCTFSFLYIAFLSSPSCLGSLPAPLWADQAVGPSGCPRPERPRRHHDQLIRLTGGSGEPWASSLGRRPLHCNAIKESTVAAINGRRDVMPLWATGALSRSCNASHKKNTIPRWRMLGGFPDFPGIILGNRGWYAPFYTLSRFATRWYIANTLCYLFCPALEGANLQDLRILYVWAKNLHPPHPEAWDTLLYYILIISYNSIFSLSFGC
jgi:hypothetical protein